jgi:Domain of unknown function (DUF3883)
MPEDWTQQEVDAIVADYFAMWEMELRGKAYTKAEHNRLLQKNIPTRTRSSIEKKHQNISAVLWHLDYPYIDGYKPLPSYQGLLRVRVEDWLARDQVLNQLVAEQVQAQVKALPPIPRHKPIQVPPPNRKEVKRLVEDEKGRRTNFVRRNYLESEANNQSLGLAGEEFVLRCEHERLWRLGKHVLADRIEHVAKTKGDYLGFDILSFEANGCERLIEVKTTRFGALTRFFASTNEVEISESNKQSYHLHRLFNFDKHPQFFVLSGSLRNTCQLKPVVFSAVPN